MYEANETTRKSNRDLRAMVRGAYDIQQLRVMVGNRVVANTKARLGQAPGADEDTLDEESKKLLALLRGKNKLLTDSMIDDLSKGHQSEEYNVPEPDSKEADTAKKEKAVAGAIEKLLEHQYKMMTEAGIPKISKFVGNAVISKYSQLMMIQSYKELQTAEKNQFDRLAAELMDFPIYTDYLKGIRGVGPAMASVIISELDPYKARYASSFCKYAGLDVVHVVKGYGEGGFEITVGEGRSKRAAHLVDREYIDFEGHPAVRKSITFNSFLKTKIVGVLAASFLRQKAPYSEHYYNYKTRLENHPLHATKTKSHRHNMALRYMMKIFLHELWANWRLMEGLPISAPYHVAKLGLDDHGLNAKLIAKYSRGWTLPYPQ